jgi:DNA-binding transcriptional regulator PaaX
LNLTEVLLCSIALGEKLSPEFYNNQKIAKTSYNLRRYRFVRHAKKRVDNNYLLTPKGENKLRDILIDDIEIKNPKRWDGKWRLVMYDFPIRFKKARNAFRFKLKQLGFFQFQKSAWIYPYPCEEEILFVADFYGVRKHLEILEVGKILDDRKIKKYFGLQVYLNI